MIPIIITKGKNRYLWDFGDKVYENDFTGDEKGNLYRRRCH
jgi:hypothetical protein